MWLAKKLAPGEIPAPLQGLFGSNENGWSVVSGEEIPLTSVIAPYGYFALPALCTKVAAGSIEGEQLLLGQISKPCDLELGEILISSEHGGYIRFNTKGEVIINGLVITSDGVIQTAESEEA